MIDSLRKGLPNTMWCLTIVTATVLLFASGARYAGHLTLILCVFVCCQYVLYFNTWLGSVGYYMLHVNHVLFVTVVMLCYNAGLSYC